MRRVALILLLVAACEQSNKKPPTKEVQGTLSLEGKPLAITTCRAGRGVTTFVELETAAGTLRFEDKQMFWRTDSAPRRGDALPCDKLERSWGGGLRKDGSSYFRGHLIFVCRAPQGPLAGDLTVDCGGITADERKQLDDNRRQMLDEQGRGSGSGSTVQ